MKTYVYILLVLCGLVGGALLLSLPQSSAVTVQGKINPEGELVANDGKVYVVVNLGNLTDVQNLMGKEVDVTGYIAGPGQVPYGILPSNSKGRGAIEVLSFHVMNSPILWNDCLASCEPHYYQLKVE